MKTPTIYSRGDLDLLSDKYVRLAIVGSRRMSDYGRRVIEEWIPNLVQNGVVTVSGLMTGVDETVHEQTILNGGQTIGIAGWGIDWSGDNNIVKLQEKIVHKNGLILSEYKADTSPKLWMFPRRNRLVAGYSTAVLVVEAAENSGSIITANWALKYKKKLLVVPGSVFSSVSRGTNKLIQEGAVMVRNPQEILDVIASPLSSRAKRSGVEGSLSEAKGISPLRFAPVEMTGYVGDDTLEKQIFTVLESGPKMLDEMVKILDIPAEKLTARLTMMEIMGEIKNRNGRYEI